MAPTKHSFWDIKKDFIEQNDHSLCSWDPWDCKQSKIFKALHFTGCCRRETTSVPPIPASGHHIGNGWGHLYAATHGLHLLINENGKVHGSPGQSSYSLVEIRPVDTDCVAFKGVAASQYLCMEGNGRLYALQTYMKDDCSFKENILPDGYNIYVPDEHGTLVNLGGSRQRLQGRDRCIPELSQFLPRVSTLPLDITTDLGLSAHTEQGPQSGLDIDTMDAFRKLSLISVQSPSFNKR